MQEISSDFHLVPYIKINLKWIIDINVRVNTIKLLEKNMQKDEKTGIGLGENIGKTHIQSRTCIKNLQTYKHN